MNQISLKIKPQKMIGLLVILILIAIDQALKYWAVHVLERNGPIVILKDVFELYFLKNYGAAFGMLQGKKLFFLVLTIVIFFLALWLYLKLPQTKHFLLLRITLIMLLAGAAGNFIDRITHTYVIDFLYFKLIDFPVFNFADICVTFAEIFLVISIIFVYDNDDFRGILPRFGKQDSEKDSEEKR